MKKTKVLLLVFLFTILTCSVFLFSKENKNVVFKLSLLSPGVFTEFRISKNFTLNCGIIGLANVKEEDDQKIVDGFKPFLSLSSRYYYNFKRRKNKGRRIDKFSGNYIGVQFVKPLSYSEGDIKKTTIGPVWGVQRSIDKFGFVDFNIGLPMEFTDGKITIYIDFSLGLGFSF